MPPRLDHVLLRHFLLGFAHANSAPPHFTLRDIDLNSEFITSQLDPNEIEAEMEEMTGVSKEDEHFWYTLGRKADEGYTLLDENNEKMLCFQFLEETL